MAGMGLASIARNQVVKRSTMDIITFATCAQGLNQKLFPSQRFLLKLLKHIPLDDTVRDIQIRDKFNKKVLATFTEREFYEYLRNDGRLSLSYEDYMSTNEIIQINLVMGRRASKSTVI